MTTASANILPALDKSANRSAFPYASFMCGSLLSRCWLAEVDFLTAIAAGPRQCWSVLQTVPITRRSFLFPDTATIFTAIERAADPKNAPVTLADMAMEACQALIEVKSWDQERHDMTAAPDRIWGPESLAAVFLGVRATEIQLCEKARSMLDTGTKYLRTIIDAPLVA